jgi:predicted negative regulator of RcsB-dependent stress response
MDSRESVLSLLVNMGESDEEIAAVAERVDTRFEATGHSIGGDILLRLGMKEQAMAEYNTALEIDPAEKNWLNSVWLQVR